MKGKILLCLALVTLMLLGVFMIGSVGAQSTTIGVEPDSIIDPVLYAPGSTFTVEIWIRNVVNLAGVEFKLGYDTTVLTATLITYGDIFGAAYFPLISNIDDAAGVVHYSIMEAFGEPAFTGDGRVAIIDFTVDTYGESVLDLFVTKLGDDSSPPVPIVHDALNGYFSNIHKWLEFMGSPLPPGDPTGTQWHELYPEYSNTWEMTSWDDTGGDGNLSISDIIDMTPITPPGPLEWFHVEEVTITLYIEGIKKWGGMDWYMELEGGWPDYDVPLTDPVSTQWHEVYPTFSNRYHLDAWTDGDGSGDLTPGDVVTLTNKETGDTSTHNVVTVSTDIIIKRIPPPAPEFPLGVAMEIGLIAAIAYVWWRSRRKIKPIKTTYNR